MANAGAIIIDPSSFLLMVCDQKIDDWAATGTACELAPVGPISTHSPGYKSHIFVLGVPSYTLTINVQFGSASDNYLELATTAFIAKRQPWSVSASREGQSLFSTIIAGPTTQPMLPFSLDSQPVRSWVVGLGLEKIPTAGLFTVKAALTKAEVQAFAP
jgi:hypothetical protein